MVEHKLDELLSNIPNLHFWGGKWNNGGLWPAAVRLLIRHAFLAPAANTVILETGAGLSTLAVLSMAPKRVISIAPDKELFGRIKSEAIKREIDLSCFTAVEDYSEIALPKLVLDQAPFVDFAFMDGGHNFPSVWVDFVYMHYALKQGGVLGIDDVQLYSCRSLALYLKNSDEWAPLESNPKTVYFQKKTDRRLERDFGASKFVVMNSL